MIIHLVYRARQAASIKYDIFNQSGIKKGRGKKKSKEVEGKVKEKENRWKPIRSWPQPVWKMPNNTTQETLSTVSGIF